MRSLILQTLGNAFRQSKIFVRAARSTGLIGALRIPAVARFALQSIGQLRNPSRIVSLHALNDPERVALVQDVRRFTYRELDERIDRVAAGFAARGVRSGARVAVMLRNGHEYLECQWATTRIGAIIVQIGYSLKPAEVAYILEHCEPTMFICGATEEPVARAAAARIETPLEVIVAGPGYEAMLAQTVPTRGSPPRSDERGGVMIYTSGTTGRPKGAARDFKKPLHESVADFLVQLGLHHDDRHLVVCPLYHSAAPAFVTFTIAVGGTVILVDPFEPEQVLDLIARERVTSSFMIPTLLGRLATAVAAHPGRWDLSSLRWLASGAAPLPTETARRVEAAFGPILYNFYGATETGLVTLARPGEHTQRPGTIGRPLSGNELRLLDDQGRDVAPGSIGELYVRNSMLVAGYHRDRTATEQAMRDGFFSVGDMARADADGYYYLADRKTDMVISGGVNIHPLEIEQRLHAHPAVQEAAVIGVPDPEWGEALKAFVVKRPAAEVSTDELRSFCKAVLANFKCPKYFEFIDTMPRNPTGKILKRELRLGPSAS